MSGLKLAALYGFYPHRLGFCGSQEKSAKKILSAYLQGEGVWEQKAREVLKSFEGAFPYYKLIAQANGIKDPFDEKAVRAYWLGNELLEKVPVVSLKKMIAEEFAKPTKKIPQSSKAHHSFHVLVVGSVTGRIKLAGKLLDFCRVSWGRVIKAPKTLGQKSKVLIEHQPLVGDKNFKLGKPAKKEVFWDRMFVSRLKKNDAVSLHWNHVIQVLGERDMSNLEKYTQNTIDSLN